MHWKPNRREAAPQHGQGCAAMLKCQSSLPSVLPLGMGNWVSRSFNHYKFRVFFIGACKCGTEKKNEHREESDLCANIGMWKKEIILGWECWEECDLLFGPAGHASRVGAGAQILLCGVWHRDSRQREIKRQLKENFSDLCFCLTSWQSYPLGHDLGFLKGEGRTQQHQVKNTPESCQDFLIVKIMADVDYRGSITYAYNIHGDLLLAKNQYVL